MNNNKQVKQNAPGARASCAFRMFGNIADLSEVDLLLNQLLPQEGEGSVFTSVQPDSISYTDIHKVTLDNGVHAVKLPDGTMLARALDRREGNVFWMKVRA